MNQKPNTTILHATFHAFWGVAILLLLIWAIVAFIPIAPIRWGIYIFQSILLLVSLWELLFLYRFKITINPDEDCIYFYRGLIKRKRRLHFAHIRRIRFFPRKLRKSAEKGLFENLPDEQIEKITRIRIAQKGLRKTILQKVHFNEKEYILFLDALRDALHED